MKNHNLYTCNIEKSKINDNYTIWLPEQDDNDFVDLLVEQNDFNQGKLWEILLKTCAKEDNLDVSSVYFEPEGNVFVAYCRNYDLCKAMEISLNKMVLNDTYLSHVVGLSGLSN